MQMLYEVGLALSESLDPTHVAEQILHRALAMVDARAGVLLTRSPDGRIQATSDIGLASATDVISSDVVGTAWQQSGLSHVDRGEQQVPRHLTLVPLLFHDEVAGMLIVADKEQRVGSVTAFDGADEALLESFALQAGAALRNARLHQDLASAFEELKTAQEKIAQLEQLRSLGELAADLTHAMRHVMGLVIGHADTCLTLKTDATQALQAILQAAEGGQDLIARIDRVTRLGVGSERSAESLNDLVEEAVADAKQLAATASVTWTYDAGADLPTSYMNRADIKEALVNLLLNAAQAISGEGTVKVHTDLIDGHLCVEVADTGQGMADSVRERIFEPFFTTKHHTGSGLGLSIVLRIIDAHDGVIDVESTQDQGTTFTLRLPMVSSPDPASDDIPHELHDADDTEDSGRR